MKYCHFGRSDEMVLLVTLSSESFLPPLSLGEDRWDFLYHQFYLENQERTNVERESGLCLSFEYTLSNSALSYFRSMASLFLIAMGRSWHRARERKIANLATNTSTRQTRGSPRHTHTHAQWPKPACSHYLEQPARPTGLFPVLRVPHLPVFQALNPKVPQLSLVKARFYQHRQNHSLSPHRAQDRSLSSKKSGFALPILRCWRSEPAVKIITKSPDLQSSRCRCSSAQDSTSASMAS